MEESSAFVFEQVPLGLVMVFHVLPTDLYLRAFNCCPSSLPSRRLYTEKIDGGLRTAWDATD